MAASGELWQRIMNHKKWQQVVFNKNIEIAYVGVTNKLDGSIRKR